jgi:sulfur carrier protein ThiS
MNCLTIRFYAELNDFLPPEHKQVAFKHEFLEQTSIKDLIESLEVPSANVLLVLVNGHPVPLSKQIKGGETVAVYPKFQNFDISSL